MGLANLYSRSFTVYDTSRFSCAACETRGARACITFFFFFLHLNLSVLRVKERDIFVVDSPNMVDLCGRSRRGGPGDSQQVSLPHTSALFALSENMVWHRPRGC